MVLKFLGLGKSKKSEYFLEAEPQPSNGSEPTAKADLPQAKSAPETNKKQAKAEAKAEASAPAKVVAAATEVTATAAKATEALTNTVTKATKATQSKKAKAPQKDAPAPVEKVAPVAKIDTTPKAVTNFATDHLLPTNTPRRRPGPSLDGFKEMARQVNNRK